MGFIVAVDGIVKAVENFTNTFHNYQESAYFIFGQGYGSIYAILASQRLLNAVDGIVKAVENFTNTFHNYQESAYFIFGQGYGSIYAILASQRLLNSKTGIKLKRVGLENSLLSYTLINIMPNEMYFSGLLGRE
ncbi:unnamed protein product [Gongylonema pulchrum]|uniref:DUF2235 domain-containing protein n=1 Tax=Gongylonema pulchrum TaxID=637853 RepID=A0A183E2V7_9BILA|nr:unnamed protein product [Gongylonema pulchrum]